MPRKMTAWGVGPRLIVLSLPYVALAAILHFCFPAVFLVSRTFHPAFPIAGSVLIAGGIVLWASGGRVIHRAFNEGRLLTSGPYAIVRHPIYSGFIVFIVPGIALWLRSWLLLTVPVVAAILFVVLIRDEERYLEQKFGQAYKDYRSRVHTLVPFLRPCRLSRR